MHDPDESKRELLDKIRVLRNNCKGEKKPSILSLLRVISQHACEGRIKCLLERRGSSETNQQYTLLASALSTLEKRRPLGNLEHRKKYFSRFGSSYNDENEIFANIRWCEGAQLSPPKDKIA